MFGRKGNFEETIVNLKKEKFQLIEELEELKLKKKMELKEVEHLVQMAREKNAIQFERKVAEIEKNKQQEISTMQKNYYEKLMGDLKEMTAQIMKRLPNVNLEIRKRG